MLQSCQVSTRPSPHRVLTCRSRGEWNAWRVTCENFWPRCCCEYFLYVTHPPASTTCPQSAHSPSSEMFTGFSNYPECSFIYLFIYRITDLIVIMSVKLTILQKNIVWHLLLCQHSMDRVCNNQVWCVICSIHHRFWPLILQYHTYQSASSKWSPFCF